MTLRPRLFMAFMVALGLLAVGSHATSNLATGDTGVGEYFFATDSSRNVSRSNNCSFNGNPDLYGLGIRLGSYFQWLSAFVICRYHPNGNTELFSTYLIFTLAIVVATLAITAAKETTRLIEIALLSYLIFGGAFIAMGVSLLRLGKPGRPMRPVQCITLSLLMSGTSFFYIWFWHNAKALQKQYPSEYVLENRPDPCNWYIQFFGPVSIFTDGINYLCALLWFTTAMTYLVICWRAIPWSFMKAHHIKPDVQLQLRYEPFKDQLAQKIARQSGHAAFMFFLGILVFVWTVISIELTLHWNHIDGVNAISSVGQLIPFAIGLVSWLRVVYEAIRAQYLESSPRWSLITSRDELTEKDKDRKFHEGLATELARKFNHTYAHLDLSHSFSASTLIAMGYDVVEHKAMRLKVPSLQTDRQRQSLQRCNTVSFP